jgi:hypothetical protein
MTICLGNYKWGNGDLYLLKEFGYRIQIFLDSQKQYENHIDLVLGWGIIAIR